MNITQQKINEEIVDILRKLTTDVAWIKNELEMIRAKLILRDELKQIREKQQK